MNGAGWAGQIYGYIKSKQVYTCPDDKFAGMTNMTIWASGSSTGTAIDYAYNPMLVDGGTNACPPILCNSSKLNSPAVTVCLQEVNSFGRWTQSGVDVQNAEAIANGQGVYSPVCGNQSCINITASSNNSMYTETGPIGCPGSNQTSWNNAWQTPTDFPTGRHSGGSNYLFFDGHVKWLVGTKVSFGRNAASSTTVDPCGYGTTVSNAAGTQGTMNGVPVVATFSIY